MARTLAESWHVMNVDQLSDLTCCQTKVSVMSAKLTMKLLADVPQQLRHPFREVAFTDILVSLIELTQRSILRVQPLISRVRHAILLKNLVTDL